SEHSAALLFDGRVLVVGGTWTDPKTKKLTTLASAELYDPAAFSFAATGDMMEPRQPAHIVLLPNGKVLVTGGFDKNNNSLASAALYDPLTGTVRSAGAMNPRRASIRASVLRNGKVLIIGAVDPLSGDPLGAHLSHFKNDGFTTIATPNADD